MSPEQTRRWQEYGREIGRDRWMAHRGRPEELEAQIRWDTGTNRQAFYVAMTAYRKELARKQTEPNDDRY